MINNYYQYDKYQTEFFLKLRFLRDLGKQGYFVHKNIDIIKIFFFLGWGGGIGLSFFCLPVIFF